MVFLHVWQPHHQWLGCASAAGLAKKGGRAGVLDLFDAYCIEEMLEVVFISREQILNSALLGRNCM